MVSCDSACDQAALEMAENGEETSEPLIAGQYRLVRRLAEASPGGFAASVLLVEGAEDGEKYVLKQVPISSDRERKLVRKEARLQKELLHPNVCRYFGLARHQHVVRDAFGPEQRQTLLLLVLEYLPNGDLARRIETNGAMSREKADRILLGIARGLAYLHDDRTKKPIHHRDMKPENVCFDTEDNPKITDFGVSDERYVSVTSQRTMKAGTLAYMSPERLRQDSYGWEDDIWALGIMYAEMLAGERVTSLFGPSPGMLDRSTVDRILSRWDNNLLAQMLSEDRSARPYAEDIVAALDPQVVSSPSASRVSEQTRPVERALLLELHRQREGRMRHEREEKERHENQERMRQGRAAGNGLGFSVQQKDDYPLSPWSDSDDDSTPDDPYPFGILPQWAAVLFHFLGAFDVEVVAEKFPLSRFVETLHCAALHVSLDVATFIFGISRSCHRLVLHRVYAQDIFRLVRFNGFGILRPHVRS